MQTMIAYQGSTSRDEHPLLVLYRERRDERAVVADRFEPFKFPIRDHSRYGATVVIYGTLVWQTRYTLRAKCSTF